MLEERTIPGLHAALMPVVGRLRLAPHDRILDVACGTGAWLVSLHRAGYRDLWGTDRDVGSFAAGALARFIPGDLDAQLALPTDCALVTMIEIIEHVANPYWLVARAANALKPGGWILISSPNIYSLHARMRFALRARLPGFERSRAPIEEDHLHPIVLEAYRRKIFDALNLTVERIWTVPAANASPGSRLFIRAAAKALRLVMRDELPGETLCLLLRKP
ncbi:MAG: class I SAM-dependent methyltransferase [Candidatus Binataceae bacterium]|nr:class I SAM-dependent methyltransferase [Candidatus Binataceae bacterium]